MSSTLAVSAPFATRGRRAVIVAVLAALAVLVSIVGTGVTPAKAYQTFNQGGLAGSVNLPAATAYGMTFVVPGITAYRNGAVPAGTEQKVTATYTLEFYNGSAWKMVDQLAQVKYIPNTGQYAWFDSYNMTPRYNYAPQNGYYRVTYQVKWGYGWNAAGADFVSGTRSYAPNVMGDNRCGTNRCTAYAPYLYVLK